MTRLNTSRRFKIQPGVRIGGRSVPPPPGGITYIVIKTANIINTPWIPTDLVLPSTFVVPRWPGKLTFNPVTRTTPETRLHYGHPVNACSKERSRVPVYTWVASVHRRRLACQHTLHTVAGRVNNPLVILSIPEYQQRVAKGVSSLLDISRDEQSFSCWFCTNWVFIEYKNI